MSDYNSPLTAAIDYLENFADVFQIPAEQLNHLHQQVSFLDPESSP